VGEETAVGESEGRNPYRFIVRDKIYPPRIASARSKSSRIHRNCGNVTAACFSCTKRIKTLQSFLKAVIRTSMNGAGENSYTKA
jgi:hypothetical protein